MVVFLPAIGGGGQGGGGSNRKPSPKKAPALDSAKKGMSYPGPQQIRSDSASPTNRFQTLLQPGREDLPILDEPVDLPNLVSIKHPGPTLQPRLPDPEAADFVKPFVKPAPEPSRSDDGAAGPLQSDWEDLLSVAKPPPHLPKPIRIRDDRLAMQPGVSAKLPEPVKAESQPTQPLQPQAAEAAAAKAPRDIPKPVAIREGEVALKPGLPEPAVGPPDGPEEPPAKPSNQAATQQLQVEIQDLPVQEVAADLPEPISKTEEAVDSQAPKAESKTGLAEVDESREQPAEEQSSGSTERPIESVARAAPTLSDASRKVAPASMPLPSTELGNLLALTPAPKPMTDPIEIPAAEARGQFEISPHPSPETSEPQPGSASGQGDQYSDSRGDASGSPPSQVTITFGSGNGEGSGNGGGQMPGSQAGSGSGSGSGPGTGAGSGPGAGPFAGITVVGGLGGAESSSSSQPFSGITVVGGIPPTDGSTSGAASADEPFAGITTVGGIADGEAAPNSALDDPTPRPVETQYGVVVLSTQDSGGGLPNVGVFSNERIHTVYLDMRHKDTDEDPVWTVEFAEPWDSEAEPTTVHKIDQGQRDFVKPSPAVKEKPELPQELVRQYVGSMIIVYALIDAEGKIEQLSVKESPDPLFNQPVLEALSKWVFRPGALNGKPVAVKALFGIPVWAGEQD